MLRWTGNFIHFLFLFLVFLIAGIFYLLARLGTLILVWPGSRRARAVGHLRGWMLRHVMTTCGATFVKMGQVMSTRPDLFSPEVIAQLRRLQDRMPAFSFRQARKTVQNELGRPLTEIFSEFDETPVAAASVAQVHRARLQNGDEVAVKILRPRVRRGVLRDAAILLAGARMLALSKKIRLSNPVGHLEEFVNAIIDQTDLRNEARNYQRFYDNFEGYPGLSFPTIYEDLSTERVIVMEFIHGTKIDQLPDDFDREPLADTLRNAMFKMCFDDGFLHADLHPGNMLVRDDGRLVLFDVGLAKFLGEDVLIQFIDMSKCLAMGNPEDLVEHLRRFHTYLDDTNWDALTRDVEAFSKRFRSQDVGDLEYSELFNEMFAIGRNHHVQPLTDMTLVFVALITAQGIGKMLDSERNVFADVAAYLIPILMRRNENVPTSNEATAARNAAK